VLHTGVPLSPGFLARAGAAGEPGSARVADLRESLGLRRELFTVLVTGGSQGASALNRVVPAALGSWSSRVQVVHLTGTGREEEVGARYRSSGVHAAVKGFTRDMASLYEAADLVICRGGALTLAELMALGRACVVIPYPWHKDGHQRHNARALADRGAATVILQEQLSAERLAAEVGAFIDEPGRAARMGALARAMHRPGAGEEISEDVARVAELRS
jgi:UDP-N-acetylglucosamine--N-acetylmuramyl-(pentapeptide) pyrophosphoryl-undecaprenol N-acetylglucosamine transferase